MLVCLVKVVGESRGRHSTLDVLELSGAAVMLLWVSVWLQWRCSGPQWGCSEAALGLSGAAVEPPGGPSGPEACFLDVSAGPAGPGDGKHYSRTLERRTQILIKISKK